MRPLTLPMILTLAFGLALDGQAAGTDQAAPPVADAWAPAAEDAVLLAKARKRKKKKKKKKDVAEAPPSGDIHAAQEGDGDEPYTWEVTLLSDLRIDSRKQGDADPIKTANYDLSGQALRLLTDSALVGAGLDYRESTFKTEEDSDTARRYVLEIIGKYAFGDLNVDETLFFVQAAVGFGSSTAKTGDTKTESSITQYGLGAGMHYFVDTNVAFTGQVDYDAGSEKVKDADDPVEFSTIHLLKLGFSLFI